MGYPFTYHTFCMYIRLGNMMSNLRRIVIWVVLFVMGIIVIAQDDECPTLVQNVLTSVQEACADLGRNQVCYGNTDVIAFDFDEAAIQDFELSGDTVDVFNLSSLSTTPMDVSGDVWGVALLALQANLPDTTPGQNVTFVVYGDTQLTNEIPPDSANDDIPTITATSTGAINVRSGPGTTYGVIGALAANDDIVLQGRNEAGDWAHFIFDDRAGWAYVPLLTVEGEVATLDVTQVGNEHDSRYTMPMQAFQLRTGIGRPACSEAPRDGLLVQAPQNTTVYFRINGIDVSVGSTALLQVEEDDTLGVHTFDGMVEVTSANTTRTVEPGFRVDVAPDSPPTEPEPYDYADVSSAPVNLLPDEIRIPFVVPGNVGAEGWVDSGVVLQDGQTFTLEASGHVNIWPQCNQFCTGDNVQTDLAYIPSCSALCNAVSAGPAGSVPINQVVQGVSQFFPMPDENAVSLLGRIGDGEPFYVGAGNSFVADNTGRLQFRINEDSRVPGDETGRFIVFITIGE